MGTRGSELALAQTRAFVRRMTRARPGIHLEERIIKTSGDVFATKPIQQFGGYGVFVRDIDLRILRGEIDLAVHSLKDIPTRMVEGLEVAAYLPRRGGRDVLVSHVSLDDLPSGAVVGTSSVRRRAQLLRHRRDLEVRPIRGNVTTRIEKWKRGEYDAIVLSKAGLIRLGLEVDSHELDPSGFVPSPGQGVVAVTALKDSEAFHLAREVDHERTRLEAVAERSVLSALGGGCLVPIGVMARLRGHSVRIMGEILSRDGEKSLCLERTFDQEEAVRCAARLAEELLNKGGAILIEDTIKEVKG
ncbi:MAG: hydroxymethylbilane synthase [Thermoplasmata archaeon]